MVLQVEYYFSDENLPNDKYMLSLIKKNKEGFGEYWVHMLIKYPVILLFRTETGMYFVRFGGLYYFIMTPLLIMEYPFS